MSNIDELIEKLTKGRNFYGQLNNPDGPAAAAALTSLQERNRKLEEALRAILAMPGTHLLRGTHNTPNCEHPLCIARALLGDGA